MHVWLIFDKVAFYLIKLATDMYWQPSFLLSETYQYHNHFSHQMWNKAKNMQHFRERMWVCVCVCVYPCVCVCVRVRVWAGEERVREYYNYTLLGPVL
jgi:hypothetical protein